MREEGEEKRGEDPQIKKREAARKWIKRERGRERVEGKGGKD